jgi:SAM-dependent methyltransferase
VFIVPATRTALPRLRADTTSVLEVDDDLVPVLDGIPILVDDAAAWCARHRDSILASLVGAGIAVGQEALAVVEAMAAQAPRQTPALFVDDFTPEEAVDFPMPGLVDEDVQALLESGRSPLSWLNEQLKSANTVVELGPGAGGLSSLIAPRAKKRHVIVDQSLRCVLLARSRARVAAGAHADRVRGVVANAEALPFADGSVDTLVAENLVDLLDDPEAFVDEAARVVVAGGTLLLTTPDPGLGGDDDDVLTDLLTEAGFTIDDVVDGLRWPRVHGPRHVELWTCIGLRCTRNS